jgi:glutamate/tyrosine decarboxylase-like PLP-dependent enzyme
MAYGKEGYAEIVERNCRLAEWLGNKIERSGAFELLAPVHLNGICFTFKKRVERASFDLVKAYLRKLKEKGDIFLTPTIYKGIPAIRVSIANWKTTQKDVEIAWQSIQHEIEEYV